MKYIVVMALLALGTSGAMAKPVANPPTTEQLDAFYAACVHVAPEASVLCTCKRDAAPKLIDAEFMTVVIASIKGKPLDAKYYDAYNDYIGHSNQICKPDY